MRAILVDCTNTILREISMPEMKRRDVAQTYHLCRIAGANGEPVDWVAINKAILTRWSESGLIWIKNQAASGKCFQEKP